MLMLLLVFGGANPEMSPTLTKMAREGKQPIQSFGRYDPEIAQVAAELGGPRELAGGLVFVAVVLGATIAFHYRPRNVDRDLGSTIVFGVLAILVVVVLLIAVGLLVDVIAPL